MKMSNSRWILGSLCLSWTILASGCGDTATQSAQTAPSDGVAEAELLTESTDTGEASVTGILRDGEALTLDRGSVDGVDMRMRFQIKRGSLPIAIGSVESVEDEQCVVRILEKTELPQAGDQAFSPELRRIREAVVQRNVEVNDGISAQVVRVQPESGLVVIAAGEREGVQRGMWFTLHDGTRFVGNVKVSRVFDHVSSGTAMTGTEEISEGQIARSLSTEGKKHAALADDTPLTSTPPADIDPMSLRGEVSFSDEFTAPANAVPVAIEERVEPKASSDTPADLPETPKPATDVEDRINAIDNLINNDSFFFGGYN